MTDKHYIHDDNLLRGLLSNNETPKGSTNMTQHSILPVMFKSNMANRPEDFTLTEDHCAKITAASAKVRAGQPVKVEPVKQEYNRLRQQLFDLQQYAKGFEVQINNTAGTVRNLEDRLAIVLKNKKQHEEEGNMLGARTYEHQAQLLEDELAETRDKLTKLQKYSAGSARQLRAWESEFGPRLKELKKIAV